MPGLSFELFPVERKARLRLPSRGVPLRPPAERVADFEDVLGQMDAEWARYEASRCMHCPEPAPCRQACPANNNISLALWLIEQGRFLEAAAVYRQTSSFPEICGRLCPQDRLCEGACARQRRNDPVPTGALEVFVTEYERRNKGVAIPIAPPTGCRVAVIGAGPAGLSCAGQLARRGHWVTIFEARSAPGGMMRYGIPNYKLPARLLDEIWADLERAGVSFVGNTSIGPKRTVDSLMAEGFEAVFIGTGAGLDISPDIPGVDLPGVYKATDFLIRANWNQKFPQAEPVPPPEIGRHVIVIGTGDTALDCARIALRLGAKEVSCIFERAEEEMLGRRRDRVMAIEEGVRFHYLVKPLRFLPNADGRLAQIQCVHTRMRRPAKGGERRPFPIRDSDFTIEADTAILSLGYYPDPAIAATTPGLKTHQWGLLIADHETGATSRFGIFTGGDVVSGPDLIVTAMVAGRKAAETIDAYLS